MAFVCLPLIDQFGHLIRGRKSLRMWPISASSDDKTTASFGYIFRGPMRENCVESAHPQTLVTIEFEKFVNPVVAPVNVPYVAPNLRIVGEKIDIKKLQKRKRVRIEFLVKVDPLYELNDEDRAIIWESRHYLLAHAQALPKFLQSVDWFSSDHRHEAHRMLKEWAIPISPVSAIELLDVKYADSTVREYAVSCLRVLQDDELRLFLLQLIQTVKFELYHDSSLVRFLIERALRNPFSIGHPLFWHLKAELYQVEHCERFAVILEEYLSFAGLHTRELRKQVDAMNKFARVSGHIAGLLRAKEKSKDEVKAICQEKLTHLNNSFFNKIGSIQIPINPRWVTSSLVVEKCKFMSSKMAPLWLVFKNADPEGPDLVVIFKSGDDLRQDILTLQLLQVMDKIWLSESLDMRLTCYTCVATGWNAQGKGVGMIEAVLQSSTLSGIQKEFGGGAIGALRLEPIHRYVRNWNRRDDEFEKAVENFWRSCAGYCVSTYVMGIGDRHNGNIMVTHDGHLFHIDFGHFLGNFKQKFGINRERAAFVLTPEMAFVMGGKKYKKSKTFQKFGEISKDAFKILRKHADLFINLFVLMVSAGMPELLVSADIDYLRRMFYLEQGEKEAVGMLEKEIKKSLNTTYRQIDNMIHIWKHGG